MLVHRELNREKFQHSSETAERVCEDRSNAAVWVRFSQAESVPQPFKHTVDQGFFVQGSQPCKRCVFGLAPYRTARRRRKRCDSKATPNCTVCTDSAPIVRAKFARAQLYQFSILRSRFIVLICQDREKDRQLSESL